MKIISGVCMILGCFFGAGFVSGREIAFYFSRFERSATISITIASIVFMLLILFFFFLSNHCKDYSSFSDKYFGKYSFIMKWLLSVSILIICGSMLAGTTSLANEINTNKFITLMLTLILTFLLVKKDIGGLSKINTFFLPVLIIILTISVFLNNNTYNSNDNISVLSSIVTGISYIFINITTLGMFVLEIGSKYTKKDKIIISILSSFIIGVILMVLSHSISTNHLTYETMPNLMLASKNRILYVTMFVLIYIGLFTTFVANVFVLSNFLNKYIKNKTVSLILILLFSLILSLFGFDKIVGYIYSFIGVVGILIVIVSLIKNGFRKI